MDSITEILSKCTPAFCRKTFTEIPKYGMIILIVGIWGIPNYLNYVTWRLQMQKEAEFYHFNKDKTKRFLKKYSESTNIYISSYDHYGTMLTDFSCSEEEKDFLDEIVSELLIKEILSRVLGNGLEDQVIEDTGIANIKVAASALKLDGKCKIVWFFCGVINDKNEQSETIPLTRATTLSKFMKAIDILHDVGTDYLKTQYSLVQKEEEQRQTMYSAKEMAESLRRVEALTEILKYLDSNKTIEAIMCDFLQITSIYLGTQLANIFKINEIPFDADNPEEMKESMDVMAQWHDSGVASAFDKTLNQKKWAFLEGGKPIILSSDSAFITRLQDEHPDFSAHAIVAMPVTIGNHTNLYACYIETKNERTWQFEEMQFLSDATRVLQNILERRIQKNSLASSYASLEEILEHVGCAIVVINPTDRNILFENQIMKNVFKTDSMNPELETILSESSDEKKELEFFDSSSEKWYEIHHNNISWVDGRPVGLFAIYDMTDKKRYQKRIEQQAYTDFLTGLYNRMCCERDLARIIDEAKKINEKGALLYLDLDDFKHINDGLGHQYGDVLLKSISGAVRRIEGIEDTCYRMGADEFVIVVPPRSYHFFEKIIDDIKSVFEKPWFLKDADYYCTMSMGIVTFPDEGESVEDLIKKADIAMYEAKKTGKNRVAKYNSENLSNSNKRLDMEKNMRDATVNGYREFEVYYQPIIDILKDGTPCTGAEALIRWNSSELGFINPGDFIPLAEYLGLINPIGDYVLQQACQTCKEWNENGHPEFKVNVNLSVVQLLQSNIVELVEGAVEKSGINPRNLTLEVTESLAINDMERMKEIMSNIRKLGVRIALDDFGTGYSSLNHIREIPLDVIKVDQSFVRELVEDDYSKSFIKMVAELAGAIGVSICVEGIESREQYKVLEGMNVRLVQGFYFDRPMPKSEFEKKYVNFSNKGTKSNIK